MIQVWAVTAGYHRGAKVEANQCKDGTILYSFRDRRGRPYNVDGKDEAETLIRRYGMEDVTDQMRAEGWIA